METENENLPIDYRGKFLSYIKSAVADYSQDLFALLYENGSQPKDFCSSVYFVPNVQIGKEDIILYSKRLVIYITSPDTLMGIHLSNAFIPRRYKWVPLADCNNRLRIISISKMQEKSITSNTIEFKILSPIVIRDHNRELKIDWYYTFEDECFDAILKRNLQAELHNRFGRNIDTDIAALKIQPVNVKKTVVKHYGIYIPGTIGNFILEGERYLLEYIYKAGLGSKRSLFFGCLDIA